MNYEKEYKDALERAKKELNTCGSQDCDAARQIFRFFPELKESEDERHRKWILEYLYDGLRKSDEQFKDQFKFAISWLEKQGEQNDLSKVPSREVILAIWELGNEWKELTNGVCVTVHGTQLDFIRKHWYENEYLYRKNLKTMSGKPADESESKFRDGDWIINKLTGSIYQIKNCIENVSNHKYGYDLTDGGYLGSDAIDRNYHLWTIQDAKDGNVLVNGSNIFIFSNLSSTRVMGYCHINLDDGRFYDDKGKNECFGLVDSIFTPATEEQRALLFQKIKEAGYEWDAEKKELKIEQKSWSEEDEDISVAIDNHLREYHVEKKRVLDKIGDLGTGEMCKDWLKSFKSQNHWKPSEEQMRVLQTTIRDYGICYEKYVLESLYNNLKNL